MAQVDSAFEAYDLAFRRFRGIPSDRSRGGYLQLQTLRKRLGITRDQDPPSWSAAIENYFSSPLGKYSLTDLCTRYDIFLAGKLDRFGKPVVRSSWHRASSIIPREPEDPEELIKYLKTHDPKRASAILRERERAHHELEQKKLRLSKVAVKGGSES